MSADSATEGRPDYFWPRWTTGNLLAFTLSYALMGIMDGTVNAVGAHGVTVVGIGSHSAALALGAAIIAVVQSWLLRYYLTPPVRWGPAT